MTWTILRPVGFFENLTRDMTRQGFARMWRGVGKERLLQLVACKDAGRVAAKALLQPGEWTGRKVRVAGEEISSAQARRVFGAEVGREMPVAPGWVGGGPIKLLVGDGGCGEDVQLDEDGWVCGRCAGGEGDGARGVGFCGVVEGGERVEDWGEEIGSFVEL
ncbi:hypothetical protein MMC13_004411 [Lambiella insularis]|nr:hypothetical protein [Lambiella insularis]